MSRENVEIVRKALDTFNAFMRGEVTDEDAAQLGQQLVDPQFEFHWHSRRGMFPDEPQHLRGFSEFLEFWRQFRTAFADLSIDPLEFIEASDNRVLIPCRQTGRGRESGVPVEAHFFQVWTIRDGKVRDAEFFLRRADAVEAAGLRE